MTLNLTKAEFATLKAVLGQLTGNDIKDLINEAGQGYALKYNPNIKLADYKHTGSIWCKMRKMDGTENI